MLRPLRKNADVRHIGSALRSADQVAASIEGGSIHIIYDKDMRKFLQSNKPVRILRAQMNLGDDLTPVLISPSFTAE